MSTIMEPRKIKSGRGRGRGVLALTSYEPCPRPSPATIGDWHQSKHVNGGVRPLNSPTSRDQRVENVARVRSNNDNINNSIAEHVKANHNGTNRNGYRDDGQFMNTNNDVRKQEIRNNNTGIVANSRHATENGNGTVRKPESVNGNGTVRKPESVELNVNKSEADILAKYNYKANPDKPGGFPELTIKQGEKLMLIRRGHEETENPHWWEVRNENGQQGFVPGTFCMVLEQSPKSLPWLENKRMLEEKEKKNEEEESSGHDNNTNGSDANGFGAPANNGHREVKQYQSAYDSAPATNVAEANKEYFCEVCDKNLNGPIPYKMHMSSRAHKEEEEYHRSKQK